MKVGRDIRKVPKGWEHPRDKNGKYKPMFNEAYEDVLEEWIKNHRLWQTGQHPNQLEHPEATKECKFFAQWSDNPPNIEFYNPNKWTAKEATCYQMYETATEGTPLSPVFSTLRALENWLVQIYGYDRERARKFCEKGRDIPFGDYMPANSPLFQTKDIKEVAVKKKQQHRPKR